MPSQYSNVGGRYVKQAKPDWSVNPKYDGPAKADKRPWEFHANCACLNCLAGRTGNWYPGPPGPFIKSRPPVQLGTEPYFSLTNAENFLQRMIVSRIDANDNIVPVEGYIKTQQPNTTYKLSIGSGWRENDEPCSPLDFLIGADELNVKRCDANVTYNFNGATYNVFVACLNLDDTIS